MATLAEKLIAMGFEPETDFRVVDNSDGAGPFIEGWFSSRPQPTAAELAALQVPRAYAVLTPAQFIAVLELSGMAQPVYDAIQAIANPLDRAIAYARTYYSLGYHRDDPLVEQMLPATGLTPAQLDDFWDMAASLNF